MKKTIYYLGSSVTYGFASDGISFVELLSEYEPIKETVSGTTLVDDKDNSYISRMKNRKVDGKVDLFICQLSTNDAGKQKPLGSISDSFDIQKFDTKTVAGAIEYIIAYAKQNFDCPILFYSSPLTPVLKEHPEFGYQPMVDLLIEIVKKWNIEFLDLWNDEDFNVAYKEEYMNDPIHPTLLGYKEWWTPVFNKKIKEILK